MALHIYTRTGDSGKTGLFGGLRVYKDDLRVEAYGSVDELNSVIGEILSHSIEENLRSHLLAIQHDLFQLGSDLATPLETETYKGNIQIIRIAEEHVQKLEALIDLCDQELPPLTRFILPGGNPIASALHIARVVCRRAERRTVSLMNAAPVNTEALRYLNRLSDLLFVMARLVNKRSGIEDTPWNPPEQEQKP